MFKNREFILKTRKADEGKTTTNPTSGDHVSWNEKVNTTLFVAKTVGTHMALGVCAYVLLDTYRQVQIAKNTNPRTY